MLNRALLVLLLALAGPPEGSAPVTAPSALPRESSSAPLQSPLGAWHGSVMVGTGAPRAIEASFAPGHQPGTVFGYFTIIENGRPITTLRRLGRPMTGSLVFDLKEGGRVVLRRTGDRLVGDVMDPAGQLVEPATGMMELTPVRRGPR